MRAGQQKRCLSSSMNLRCDARVKGCAQPRGTARNPIREATMLGSEFSRSFERYECKSHSIENRQSRVVLRRIMLSFTGGPLRVIFGVGSLAGVSLVAHSTYAEYLKWLTISVFAYVQWCFLRMTRQTARNMWVSIGFNPLVTMRLRSFEF